MMKRSLFLSLAAGLLASLAFGTPSQAASVTYYSSVVPQQDDFPFSANLTLPLFNPDKGTLTSVVLSVDATVVGSVQVYNSSPTHTYSFTDATSSVPVYATGPGGAMASTIATATLAMGSAAPGFNGSYGSQTGTSTGYSTPQSDLSAYTGVGTFMGTFGSNAMGGTFGGTGGAGSAGKLFFGGTATAGGQIDVTYTYIAAVPEPNSMALLGIGMAGFFTFRRLFKRPATA